MMYWMLIFGQAFAAGGGHGPVEIPWSPIFVQGLNLLLLLGLLTYLLRRTVKQHFETRAREYSQLVERAEEARREAEKGHLAIKERMARLEETAAQTEMQARAEAEELKSRMIAEAKTLSAKLEQEAKLTATLEAEKAKTELRKELLAQALSSSKDTLKQKLGSTEQKKLQSEFVEKIQVVGG